MDIPPPRGMQALKLLRTLAKLHGASLELHGFVVLGWRLCAPCS